MVTVLTIDEQDGQPVDTQRWANLARRALEAEGVPPETELSMAFVDEDVMADLNHRFAGQEGPTDVLAFSIDSIDSMNPTGDEPFPDGPPHMLGDVVICPAVARRNAPGHAGTYDDELALLVVHGVLHLLGMDHEAAGEASEMQHREHHLLGRFHPAVSGSPLA